MARTKADVTAASPRVTKSSAGVSKDSETPVKRGRGRPRSAVPKPAYVPSGRPRGRPKGSTKAALNAKKAALGEAVGLNKTKAASGDASGGKRGRGRPRKTAQPDAEGESTTPKSGKKRGRPSKNATESPAVKDTAESDNEEPEPVEAAEPVEGVHADDESDGDVPTAGQESPVDKEVRPSPWLSGLKKMFR
ncbi:hypothetical protein N0V84_010662 [Fusarium piperis]|uniref:AT hook domain-containing protein n=1 Tax=Fusarium piperis TaxID=1435070 RepID=A0A9W8TFS9_9HYPO|nr:hypothetical protein N0V84_010662 [Fusarium piperis]